jgi:hypothetical protein
VSRISFQASTDEIKTVSAIANRAVSLYREHDLVIDVIDVQMDVLATHANGNPLRLTDLLAADNVNFLHDIGGIRRHLDRNTGKLGGHFSPRFSRRGAK